ncbi:hypothetical protein GA0070606_6170 [Micromonospora citrea]|uniref:Uncharacterized protein n=1 Tax=Micromonospora citrea TaxID=47855 RepID=A0A1C6W215_9ACTN|nr:hypothetical protein [Micromonospora citrea]SCL72556.1 hypothetical protein GA0070606_6170 [Micromonospora citrea]
MPPPKPTLLLLGAALPAVVGALFGSAWATGVGSALVLGLLAVHPAVVDPAVPRSTRLLVRGVLLSIALAGAVQLSGWAASPFGDTPPSASELTALVTDPVRQRTQYLRQLAVAGCLILACACVGVAIGRLPSERLRRIGRAAPVVGALTLGTLVIVALLPGGAAAGLLGSSTDVAVAALVVLGGYAWLVRRAVRRHGAAPSIVTVGATLLAATACAAGYGAWGSRPVAGDSDASVHTRAIAGGGKGAVTDVAVAVTVPLGPDIPTATVVAMLLLGAALAVPACARLSTAASGRR